MILLTLALLAADPSSLASVLSSARPGDTVRLVAGRYSALVVRNRTFAPAVTIDAADATMSGVQIVNSTGIHWTGGNFTGDATLAVAAGFGFTVVAGADITIKNARMSNYRTAIAFERVDGGQVSNNWLTRMSSDGVDLFSSRSITVDHNACTEFAPGPFSHSDCIQLWSRPASPPTADIVVSANSAVGQFQGISLFNHVRDGVDDGGFDRIKIDRNTVLITYGDGLSVYDCRGCTVTNNSIASLPNYLHRAQLYVSGGSVMQCGNDVPMVPRQSTPPCAS